MILISGRKENGKEGGVRCCVQVQDCQRAALGPPGIAGTNSHRNGIHYGGGTVEAINNLSEQPLVERKTGGQKGGSTTLTTYVGAWPEPIDVWSRNAKKC